ncbi:hypothetical protein CVT26_004860, partial [Gymnopilus dilepis]
YSKERQKQQEQNPCCRGRERGVSKVERPSHLHPLTSLTPCSSRGGQSIVPLTARHNLTLQLAFASMGAIRPQTIVAAATIQDAHGRAATQHRVHQPKLAKCERVAWRRGMAWAAGSRLVLTNELGAGSSRACNPQQATHTRSLVTNQEGGGSSDSGGGGDGHCRSRGATSDSLFDAREVEPGAGDKTRVAEVCYCHHTSCSSSRAKRGQGGWYGSSDGLALAHRRETPTSDSLFYAREMGVWLSKRKGKYLPPARFCTARGAEVAPRQRYNQS